MPNVTFREALAVWWHIGLMSFGGPAGQIALMHRIIVEEKKWLDEARFLHALNYCMLLPGPEAQQLATYIGWLMHGVRGGLVAGLLFILPGAVAIMTLSWIYVLFNDLTAIEGIFFGLKAAVLAIVVQALIRIGKRALQGTLQLAIAAAGFLALFAFGLPFPLVVLCSGLIGYFGAKHFANSNSGHGSAGNIPVDTTVRPGTRTTAVIFLLLWVMTVLGLYLLLGKDNVFTQIATFFSRMAIVTFGGAYAVLSYVAQQGVEHYHWLKPGEMLDGLALAETTPGPLILVTQFVGFLAAYRHSGVEESLLAATLGALLTLWVTFLPCFLWIFAGAPYVEKLRNNKALSAALAAITAAVVGVITNLAVWFALNALFEKHLRFTDFGLNMLLPDLSTLNLPMLLIAVIAFVLAFVIKTSMLRLLGISALLGITWTMISVNF